MKIRDGIKSLRLGWCCSGNVIGRMKPTEFADKPPAKAFK